MADQQHDDFEQLRKLLSLKRHEQPPPGYFESFSGRVMARIQNTRPEPPSSWLRRLISAATESPALAGAYGVGALAVVVLGFALVPTPDDNKAGLPAGHAAVLAGAAADSNPATMPLQALPSANATGSLSPVLAPDSAPAGLFNAGGFLDRGQPESRVDRAGGNFSFPSYTNGQQQTP